MRVAFRTEALDLLPELDAALLALEAEPGNAELVNRVFRAIHTLKGSGATVGFTHLSSFTHRLEEAFDLARAGRLAVTSELIDCGLKGCDIVRAILDTDSEEGEVAGERAVTEAVTRLLPPHDALKPPVVTIAPRQRAADPRTAYEIVLRPNRELFSSGTDPVTLLDELRATGFSAHHGPDGPSSRAFVLGCGVLLPLVGNSHTTPMRAHAISAATISKPGG